MTKALLSRLHFPVSTLGPGQRVGIWFQGCSLGCSGCISRDTWARDSSTQTDVASIMNVILPWLSQADGITISGGEPFEQADALEALLREIRLNFAGDILVYSGFEIEQLETRLNAWQGMIDALITGPYVESAPQTLPLRGSDNQVLHCLTQLGQVRFRSFTESKPETPSKAFDLMQNPDGQIWMAGIPSRKDWKMLSAIISQDGNHGTTSSESGAARRNPHS